MDQEAEVEQRLSLHKCRLCSKSFSCGRSLGGHMRCHLSSSTTSSSSSYSTEEAHTAPAANAYAYALRENPKKTWRLSSPSHPHHADDAKRRQCRDCGRSFQSWQALFGHMRCHSRRRRPLPPSREEAAAEDSWTVPRKKRMPTRRRQHRCAAAAADSSSSSEKEQVDVAISLMMLSRDAGRWRSSASAAESADKNSAVVAAAALDGFKKPKDYASSADDIELYSDGESGKKGASCGGGGKSGKGLYECTTCSKSFHSYQALGGHRAGHKRGRGCLGGDIGFDTDNRRAAEDVGEAKGSRHQCGICGKVFGSGQALGGHKRSHLVTSSVTAAAAVEEEELAVPDLLDLNLPAAAAVDEEDSSNGRGGFRCRGRRGVRVLVGRKQSEE
ncbi:zinc finger protein ZAT4-like [Iris pallida]|uniref:Zinc finger protein ZAT4-like n=1 Tax=Iris pallida TaxID=29817 RepID=A0AAX6HLT1_IRIPA|nr:zinc finger protein ZAT4-like [Iris pallida]